MMKKRVLMIALSLLLLFSFVGCKTESAPETNVPPLHGGQEAEMIELSVDDFAAQNHITRDLKLVRPGSLIVSLGANPTTGFEWSDAEISNSAVISKQSFVYVPPQTEGSMAGTPGKNVWVFNSQQPGTSTIKMSYSRPWEGGEKDEWSLTINVSVE